MVSEKDIAALRNRAEKAEAALKVATDRTAKLENRVKVLGLEEVSDADVRNIRQLLLDQSQEMDSREDELKKREEAVNTLEASHKERETEAQIQTLADKYAPKVSGDDEDAKKKADESRKAFISKLKSAEDPEKEALRLHVESLSSNVGEDANKAEDVHEHVVAGGKAKKSPLDMNAEEIANFEKEHAAVA